MNRIIKTYWIYPTRCCNLSCSYCYQRHENLPNNHDDKLSKTTPMEMSKEVADEVLEFISKDEPDRKKRIQFFGGEPMLRWDLITYFVSRLGDAVSWSITTNGTLLDREKLCFLKEHRFQLAVSVDGPYHVNEKTRPGRTVPLDLIGEYYPGTQIIMTLCPENIADGFDSTVWLISRGFPGIAHNIATEIKWPSEAIEHHRITFEKLADLYIKEYSSAVRPNFMFISYAQKAVRQGNWKGERFICGSNPNLLAIDTNGDIFPCQDMVTCDIEKKYLIGNARDGYNPPESILLSRMRFEDRSACRFCWFFHQCVGGCGPKNLLTTGDRFKPVTNGCELYSQQVCAGMRALLNTGQLALFSEKRVTKEPVKENG